ncbi:MAG: esterase family protein [Deinococcota bacterium]|nr:esterase family protein [Deinococcota bacterium]
MTLNEQGIRRDIHRAIHIVFTCCLILLTPGAAQESTTALAGRIMTEEFSSSTLGRTWMYNVYLPDGYNSSNLEYPVIYLLHGSNGNESSWDEGIRVLDGLIQAGEVPPAIAIAPASGYSWWVDTLEPFETAITKDLIPHVDTTYRTIEDREGRAIAGFSMGGYGTLRYALVYPEVFGAATVLSPALYDQQPPPDSSARSTGAFGDPYDPELWTELNYPASLESFKSKGLEVPVFIAVGDDDWNEPAGWEFNVEYQSVLLFERLNKEAGSLAELRVVNGEHDWELWSPMLVEGLKYMFAFLRFPRASN